jgi:hypothetical protein
MRELQQRNGLPVRCLRYFFPGMRNDVMWVMQYLGSQSVTSDFHARSQTIPREICDRCHWVRLCSEHSSSVLYTPPQQIRGSHWFIHHRRYINTSNYSVVKHPYHFLTSVLLRFLVLESWFLIPPPVYYGATGLLRAPGCFPKPLQYRGFSSGF